MTHFKPQILAILLATFGLFSCNGTVHEDLACPLPKLQTETATTSGNPDINIYLDGSGSMLGYVQDPGGNYVEALEILDDTVDNAKYYRIGDPKKLGKEDYLKAKNAEFYDGSNPRYPKVSSPIHQALESPSSAGTENLTIIVSDLEQNDGDIDRITEEIQKRYFNKTQGYAVGVWAVKSQFNGKIYAANGRPLFTYNTEQLGKKSTGKYRPFYILFIGKEQRIKNYFDKIAQRKPEGSHLLIVSANNLISQAITLPNRDNLPKLPTEVKRQFVLADSQVSIGLEKPDTEPYEILEIVDSAVKDVTINGYEITLPLPKYGLPINPEKLELRTKISTFDTKKGAFSKSSNTNLSKVLTVENFQFEPDQEKLNYSTMIQAKELTEPNIHLFEVDVIARSLEEPDWWKDWDAKSRQGSQDGSKTLGIARLMRKLADQTLELISDDQNQPVVGRLCYAVQRSP